MTFQLSVAAQETSHRRLSESLRWLRIAVAGLIVAVVAQGVALLWVATASRLRDVRILDIVGDMVTMDLKATELLKSHQDQIIGLLKRDGEDIDAK